MIVFELICSRHHRFEGWFASGEDFDRQKEAGLLSCPVCGGASVEKLPTARIQKSAQPEAAPANRQRTQPKEMTVSAFIDHVLLNTEDVGAAFAEEARRIHRKLAPARGIRGTATREETAELLDEGIPVVPLPIPPRGEWH